MLLLLLDVGDGEREVAQLPRRVEWLKLLQEILQRIEVLAMLLLLALVHKRRTPPRIPAAQLLLRGNHIFNQRPDGRLHLLDGIVAGIWILDEPLRQPEELEQRTERGNRNAPGLLDMAELRNILELRLAQLLHVACVDFAAADAEHDIAAVDHRHKDHREQLGLELVSLFARHALFGHKQVLAVEHFLVGELVELLEYGLRIARLMRAHLSVVHQFKAL